MKLTRVVLFTAKNRLLKKGHKSLPGKMKSHIDDDLRMLAELSRNSDLLSQEPRWPVIDQSRPYVCQHCGVGFAREKVHNISRRLYSFQNCKLKLIFVTLSRDKIY